MDRDPSSAARDARQDALGKLERALTREPEVRRVAAALAHERQTNHFADLITAAMRRYPR